MANEAGIVLRVAHFAGGPGSIFCIWIEQSAALNWMVLSLSSRSQDRTHTGVVDVVCSRWSIDVAVWISWRMLTRLEVDAWLAVAQI